MDPPSPWKRPDQVIKMHLQLKKRKNALQERMKKPLASNGESSSPNSTDLNFSRIINVDKRKNPFSKNTAEQNKKSKPNIDLQDASSDKTLFALLQIPAKVPEKPPQELTTNKLATFSNLLQKFTAEHSVETQIIEKKYKHLPVDWTLKTRLRLMSPKPFAWTTKLKASEESSGITGFVRCIDTTTSTTLDTSPRARFHQACLYWQHPYLPWLELFPRSQRRIAKANFLATNEEVKNSLFKEWAESFRSLFQLVRTRHCPYFYVCADSLSVLFLAAGICGAQEPRAFLAPTTRGFRRALRREDVEFTMPLRPDKKKLNTSNEEEKVKNSSHDSCYDTMDEKSTLQNDDCSDDEDADEILSQLGMDNDFIKKVNNTQSRLCGNAESAVDSAAESALMVRGVDVQALFNVLLNCKSTVGGGGSGVPPTLLSPAAFRGGTLRELRVRESRVVAGEGHYHSLEVCGPLLPGATHALAAVLRASASAPYSATFAHHQPSRAFTWAAAAHAKEESSKGNEVNHSTKAFNKENLSDCGISEDILQHFCSEDPNIITVLDSVKYDPEDDTYSW